MKTWITPAVALFTFVSGALGQELLFGVSAPSSMSLGTTVAGGADLDGDSQPDLVVGAPGAFSGTGIVTAYSSAIGATLWTASIGTVAENLGRSLAAVGDLDADGITDFAAGTLPGSGVVRVISGANGSFLFALKASGPDDAVGESCAAAGDVDLDGVLDVIAGSPSSPVTGLGLAGKAFVFSGATGAVLHSISATGSGAFACGRDVAGGFDWNQDGAADVAALQMTTGSLPGLVQVVAGGSFSALATLSLPAPAFGKAIVQVEALSDVDGDGGDDLAIGGGGGYAIFRGGSGTIVSAVNEGADSPFGYRLASLGDLDGDGGADLAASTGYVEVDAYVSVRSGRTGAELLRVEGIDSFGVGLAPAGDVDFDGSPDLAIGIPHFGVTTALNLGFAGIYSLAGPPNCGDTTDYGAPCATPGHPALELDVDGCFGAGGPIRVRFSPPSFSGAVALVLAGTQAISIPIGGDGCRLLVGPLPLPLVTVIPLAWPYVVSGVAAFDVIAPATLSPGTVRLQVIASNGSELVASGGLAITIP
jgi:hypothetical protein